MLIQADASGEGEVGADPYEHLPPTRVVDIEVVLLDPTPLHLQMPTVVFSDGGHDGGGLARFDDGHDLVGLRMSEVALHEVIAPTRRIFLNGYTPFLGAVFGPVVVLRGDVAQHLTTDGIDLAIGVTGHTVFPRRCPLFPLPHFRSSFLCDRAAVLREHASGIGYSPM